MAGRTRLVQIIPGELHLPPSRISGADPYKLSEQIGRFGNGSTGMPLVQVTEGANNQFMINDGVTRATRMARLAPDATITVEVIEARPNWRFDHLPLVKERL